MSNFIDAVMVMLNPLRAGTADFIDAKFAQYIRPVLNGQGLPGYAGERDRLSASFLAGLRSSHGWRCFAVTEAAQEAAGAGRGAGLGSGSQRRGRAGGEHADPHRLGPQRTGKITA